MVADRAAGRVRARARRLLSVHALAEAQGERGGSAGGVDRGGAREASRRRRRIRRRRGDDDDAGGGTAVRPRLNPRRARVARVRARVSRRARRGWHDGRDARRAHLGRRAGQVGHGEDVVARVARRAVDVGRGRLRVVHAPSEPQSRRRRAPGWADDFGRARAHLRR